MRLFTGVSNATAVVAGLCSWGLVPEMLWGEGYHFLAVVMFIAMPYGLFYLAHSYDEWRRSHPAGKTALNREGASSWETRSH
jgi:hypothetical protein